MLVSLLFAYDEAYTLSSPNGLVMCLLYTAALQKLNLVNGVLFTGGWAKRGRYYEIVEKIFKVLYILFNAFSACLPDIVTQNIETWL